MFVCEDNGLRIAPLAWFRDLLFFCSAFFSGCPNSGGGTITSTTLFLKTLLKHKQCKYIEFVIINLYCMQYLTLCRYLISILQNITNSKAKMVSTNFRN